MKTFTSEEMNLMCLYNSGTRLELIENLTDMRGYLQADETELLSLPDCVLEKLRQMHDQEFSALDLYHDFMDCQGVKYCRAGNPCPGSFLL